MINAKSTKTIPTKIRNNTLSYLRCIKFDKTRKALRLAINKATVTVKGPKWIEVILIVVNVRNINTSKIFESVIYSMVCVVLFAMTLKIRSL